jgi:hypothetical protein
MRDDWTNDEVHGEGEEDGKGVEQKTATTGGPFPFQQHSAKENHTARQSSYAYKLPKRGNPTLEVEKQEKNVILPGYTMCRRRKETGNPSHRDKPSLSLCLPP